MEDSKEPLISSSHQEMRSGVESTSASQSGSFESPSKNAKEVSQYAKVFAALFYAVASIMIMVVNKQVLTGYEFPSFQVFSM